MSDITDSEGYQKLLKAVERDEAHEAGRRPSHNYRGKLAWVVERAAHYAEKTGLRTTDVLDAWERDRNYWYMNYYQECNQPRIEAANVRVFDTKEHLQDAVGNQGFRCPACNGASRSPYQCDSGLILGGNRCDWKVYGLFRDLGKGVTVFVKEEVRQQLIFMPIAWEQSQGAV